MSCLKNLEFDYFWIKQGGASVIFDFLVSEKINKDDLM